jgi:hypothetical protein
MKRTGNIDDIEYIWTSNSRAHAVLIAMTAKYTESGELIGQYAAFKEERNLHCDPEEFAEENKWYQDLKYEIADQIANPMFGHFDLETYISIHNTSIRTRA